MKVLLVTPDAAHAQALEAELAGAGHTCQVLVWPPPTRAVSSPPLLSACNAEVVLMDEACLRDAASWLRGLHARAPGLPVMALVTPCSIQALEAALHDGAHDVVFGPLRAGDLNMRLLIHRWRAADRNAEPVVLGPLRIQWQAHRVTRDGVAVELTAAEWRLLRLVLERRGRLVTRADLEAVLGNEGAAPDSNRIEVHLSNLRRKLGPGVIETRRGLGYRIAIPT